MRQSYLEKTANTIGGAYQENRGRRSASESMREYEKSPYVDGKESNWNHRQGWDQYFGRRNSSRKHGGSLIKDQA